MGLVVDFLEHPLVELSLAHSIPSDCLRLFLQQGMAIVGGFPLWLAGGADYYSDIDIYPLTWANYDFVVNFMLYYDASFVKETPNTRIYKGPDGQQYQIVTPDSHQTELRDLLYFTDVSPSATALVLDEDGNFHIQALYPEDIESRVCNVLIHHDWTWHRVLNYVAKGYTVGWRVWDDQRSLLKIRLDTQTEICILDSSGPN